MENLFLISHSTVDEVAAVDVLGALAHRARLRVFRLLVQAGPAGLAAGIIAQQLAMPASTLSFHLTHLSTVKLVNVAQQGRQLIYSAAFDRVQWLTQFLWDNCCAGAGGESTHCQPTTLSGKCGG
jgi:ArsR family transcriptional regulator, arsenate/arsenite/antimonite-responsive transcriptional repressor